MLQRITWLIPIITACVITPNTHAQLAVIVVRHAEKVRGNGDVPLSEKGKKRAEELARALKNVGVNAIYTSTALRTKQTAERLATSVMVEAKPLSEQELTAKLNNLGKEHGDHVVVFVGHSDTVPSIIDALMKRQSDVTIGPDEFDKMFVLIPNGNHEKWGLIRSRY